jgi:hypothetical protein
MKRRHEGPLDAVIQDLPRRNLVDLLATYWETLKIDGLYADSAVQLLGKNLEGGSAHVYRLNLHLILRHLQINDDLHQWRRSIAEVRNLNGYRTFFAENSNRAYKEYIAHIFAGRAPEDFEKAKETFKKDLQYGRR